MVRKWSTVPISLSYITPALLQVPNANHQYATQVVDIQTLAQRSICAKAAFRATVGGVLRPALTNEHTILRRDTSKA
jgi:hypothetical protein